MPARTDHDRRDAQRSAYAAIVTHLRPYIDRMVEQARADIEQEAAEYDGSEPRDWISVGEAAAYRALQSYGVQLPDHKLDAIGAALTAHATPAINKKNP